MPTTSIKEDGMRQIAEIREEIENRDYRKEALVWWRLYLKQRLVIRSLREQNRTLRLLLSDYTQ
jgi:hypothetical protein